MTEPADLSAGLSAQPDGVSFASPENVSNSSGDREGQNQPVLSTSVDGSQTKLSLDLEAGSADVEVAPLLELLDKPPGEVAGWAVEQVRHLSEAETLVESTQVFKLATAMRVAPINQKEALVTHLLQGVGDLPVEERADAVRLFSKVATSTQLDAKQPSMSSADQGLDPLLSANFSRIAEELAIAEMSPEDLRGLTDTAQKESQELFQPLMDVVPELNEDERKRVTETLVSKGFVSEENRVILEDTIKPGGHADQFASFIWWCKFAYQHAWIIWGVLPIEGVLIACLASWDCRLPALTWLLVDFVLGSILALSAASMRYILKATYQEFIADTFGTIKRWKVAYGEGKLGEAIPGLKLVIVAFVICAVSMVLGAVWACAGVSFFSETLWTTCPAPQRLSTVIICTIIASLRLGLVVALVALSFKGYRKVQQLRNHSSEPLLSENEQSYGAVEAQ